MDTITRLSDLTAHARKRAFLQYAKASALSRSHWEACDILSAVRGPGDPLVAEYRKSADAHGTTDSSYLEWTKLGVEFMSVARRQTVLGRLPGTVPIVPGTPTPVLNDDVVLDFVGEASTIPAAQLSGDVLVTRVDKLAGIIGVTKDLLKLSDERALDVLEQHLVAVVRRAEGAAFLSATAATADAPAGVLQDVIPSNTSGTFADDVQALTRAVRGGAPVAPVFVTSTAGLVALAGANLLSGGTVGGVPVINSPEAGVLLILIDGAAIGVADDGLLVEGGNSATVTFGSTPVSAFQSNVGMLRIIRYVSWTRAYDDAVGFITLPSTGSPS